MLGPVRPAAKADAPDSGARTRSRRASVSVRVRILTAVLITTALGMIGAGIVSYVLARTATYDSIRNGLIQETEEIETVARVAGRGDAGRPIRGPNDLLYVAIKSSVPDPDQAIIGLINGRVTWVPDSDVGFQKTLAADEELIRAAAAIRLKDPVEVRTIATAEHDPIAFISVPLVMAGSTDLGHYVAAVDVRSALAPVRRTHLTYALICLLALAGVGLVGNQVAGRLLSPLRALRRTAQRITDTDLSDRIPADQLSSNDEVADLGRTMNAMLDRLSSSFDNQRQMLDDAGHELRTPITIVRGHLELVDASDPTDVIKTRDLALDELDRMQRLVEELMVLAKARQPDFLRIEPVEVSALLHSVLDKVSPIADRRWVLDASSDQVVALDPQRITQALVQLVANAVRYSAPGSVIALGGRVTGEQAAFWVRDEGLGVAVEDQSKIFQRFGRGSQRPAVATGDPGLSRGLGLGLSIVSAIAEAHHGQVQLDSLPGQGSTFTVVIPLRSPAPTGKPVLEDAWPPS